MKILINGKTIEIDDKEIAKSIDDKTDLTIKTEDIVLRTKDEEVSFLENYKKENIKIGAEVGRKEVIKGLGIEGDGLHKSDETSINALKSWADGLSQKALEDAKIEPNKKIETFKQDIETLKGTISKLTTEKERVANEFSTFKKTNVINSNYMEAIPDNAILPKSDMVQLLAGKIKADVIDSGQVVGLDESGNVIKDPTTLNPVPFKEVVKNFFDNNTQYLKAAEGGAGGGDSGAGAGTSQLDSFIKRQAQLGNSEGSEAFNEAMAQEIKNGTLKL